MPENVAVLALATILTLIAVLGGCSSGVMSVGPDTYRISTEAMSRGGAEAEVVGQANRHCASLGRQAVVRSIDSTTAGFAQYAGAGVTFTCVHPVAKAL